MWIQSVLGFVSVVRKGEEGEYQIRARQRGDLEHTIKAAKLVGQRIVVTDGSDYRYRIIVQREELDRIMAALTATITYPNFKQAVSSTKGQEQHARLYHRVWSILGELQARDGGPYGMNRRPQSQNRHRPAHSDVE